ncbi:MAG: hypothetical protein JJU36_11680 [Phycisphaeraceae bacterium]|nr:hypothetical protein [Phycisphaeraceae bacterium]
MSESTTSNRTERARRWPRRLAISIAVLAGILIMVFVGIRLNAEWMYHRALRSMAAAGHPTNADELFARYRAPRDGVNAAEIYERAFALFRKPEEVMPEQVPLPEAFRKHRDGWDHWIEDERQDDGARDSPSLEGSRESDAQPQMTALWKLLPDQGNWSHMLDPIGKGAPWPEESIEAIRRYLAAHEEAIDLLLQAGRADYCYPDRDYRSMADDSVMAYLGSMRRGARLLSTKLDLALLDGQTDEAIDLLEAMVRHGAMLEDEIEYYGHLVRIFINAMALGKLEAILNLGSMSEARLDRIERSLEGMSVLRGLTMAFVGDIVFGEYWASHFDQYRSLSRVDVLTRWLGRTKVRQTYEIRETMKLIDLLEEPIDTWAAHPPLGVHRSALARFAYQLGEAESPTLLERSVFTLCRAEGFRRAALVALAIERYRLVEGGTPETLDELVPNYLSEIPANPYPTPLEYHPLDEGYFVGFHRRGTRINQSWVEPSDPGTWQRPSGSIGFHVVK